MRGEILCTGNQGHKAGVTTYENEQFRIVIAVYLFIFES
nr:MAG TPA: hypothetical protein [Caudoviricetes sp.]